MSDEEKPQAQGLKYFDAVTGNLLDGLEHKGAVEGRLAQRRPLVQVTGRALQVVEAGNEALGDAEPVEDTSRPPAAEKPAEAEAALEAHEEEQRKAHEENLALQGDPSAEEQEPLPADGEEGVNAEKEESPDSARQKRRTADRKRSKSRA